VCGHLRSACNGKMDGVERPRAIAPGNHVLGSEILHREVNRVKFHGTTIIAGKLMNIKKILNNFRCNKNIIEIERARKDRVTK
jgi:hypothetical protein